MSTNEGVGKKIVEALKRQSSLGDEKDLVYIQDDTELESSNEEMDYSLNASEGFDSYNVSDDNAATEQISEFVPVADTKSDEFEIKEQQNFANPNTVSLNNEHEVFANASYESNQTFQNQGWNFERTQQDYRPSFEEYKPQVENKAKQFEMPPNVSVLKKLISQLPTGVTKQTGAQIIKQTMEALGISMNSVLHEAQKVQDDMNDSIKNCMLTIQEYKNNIKNLEKQGLDYQRQVNQLNDLISLFILSDKD